MIDICLNDTNYSAVCKIIVKLTCEIMKNKSRYILHFNIVDFYLQFIIVFTYIDWLKNITCDVVLI